MLKAIAVQDIWCDSTEEIIKSGTEFTMGDDRINSLVAIGAAKLVSDSDVDLNVLKLVAPQKTSE